MGWPRTRCGRKLGTPAYQVCKNKSGEKEVCRRYQVLHAEAFQSLAVFNTSGSVLTQVMGRATIAKSVSSKNGETKFAEAGEQGYSRPYPSWSLRFFQAPRYRSVHHSESIPEGCAVAAHLLQSPCQKAAPLRRISFSQISQANRSRI